MDDDRRTVVVVDADDATIRRMQQHLIDSGIAEIRLISADAAMEMMERADRVPPTITIEPFECCIDRTPKGSIPNRYQPHQGKREMERRARRQMKAKGGRIDG